MSQNDTEATIAQLSTESKTKVEHLKTISRVKDSSGLRYVSFMDRSLDDSVDQTKLKMNDGSGELSRKNVLRITRR